MKIFSGTSNKPLAQNIAKHLHSSLSPLEIHVFPDGEKRVRVEQNVVGQDTIVLQSTALPADSNYMELFFIVDALKRSGAKSVTAVVPYLGYQRQDHVFRDGEAVSLQVIVETLEAVGMDRLITVDLHSIKIPEFFHVPVVHVSALPLFAQKIKELFEKHHPRGVAAQHPGGGPPAGRAGRMDSPGVDFDSVLVSPDMGGVRRVKLVSEMLDNMSYAAIFKNRDLATGAVTADTIEGEVGKRAIIVDDMISSGQTIETTANLLRKRGTEEIFVFVTHPVFSDGAPKILQNAAVEKVFVTDTIFVPKEKRFPKLKILSVAEILAEKL